MKKVSLSRIRAHTIAWPLLVSSCLSIVLFLFRYLGGHTTRYWFLLWNLVLAWVPLVFLYFLIRWLQKGRWLSWKGILLTVLWLVFLPNSFYLVTDFVHLKATGEVSVLYDAVFFMSFAWNGLLLGFTAVYIMQKELQMRLARRQVNLLIVAVFVLCSFAIYLGRYLAWNTWDLVVNPAGILFDLSERIVRPGLYPNTFTTTTLFSVALLSMYYTVYTLVGAIRADRD